MYKSSVKVIIVVALVSMVSSCTTLKKVGKDIGHTSKEVTKEIGHATRDVAKKTIKAIKEN